MKYRKKPVVIEADQFQGNYFAKDPEGVCRCDVMQQDGENQPHVHTLEGPLRISPLDWIITGVKGERYPCKPDIFAATYEAVEDPVPMYEDYGGCVPLPIRVIGLKRHA